MKFAEESVAGKKVTVATLTFDPVQMSASEWLINPPLAASTELLVSQCNVCRLQRTNKGGWEARLCPRSIIIFLVKLILTKLTQPSKCSDLTVIVHEILDFYLECHSMNCWFKTALFFLDIPLLWRWVFCGWKSIWTSFALLPEGADGVASGEEVIISPPEKLPKMQRRLY